FLPKIETYIQGEVINFYQQFAAKDAKPAYVEVYNFKSYAHLYYTDKSPITKNKAKDLNWLMHGKTDRDVYLVTKVGREETLEKDPYFKKIGGKYGYLFYKKVDTSLAIDKYIEPKSDSLTIKSY
ncbi:MAG TPA: hypothetical protein VK796_09325, partial [Cytophaga sp.]|nr:hypothetical protein [Cytophaga sp.]